MRQDEWQEGLLMYTEQSKDTSMAECLESIIWTIEKSPTAYRDNRDALLRLNKALADAEALHAARFLHG